MTGASSGIGEAFAAELASSNVDLIVVGRDLEALEAVASHARSKGVEAHVLQADLSTEEGVARVVAAICEARPLVDLLVNNAGLGQWGLFADLPLGGAIETMRVNNDALVRLTHAAVVRMLDAGHGSIIQVSSMASASPGPQQAVYAASKAFVSSLGQALSWELAGTPITCTTILPGFTRTRYFSRVGLTVDIPEKHWMSAQQVARIALDAAEQGRPLVIPGSRNRWKIAIAAQFPSLAKGRAKRQARGALESVRRTSRRLVALARTAPTPSNHVKASPGGGASPSHSRECRDDRAAWP